MVGPIVVGVDYLVPDKPFNGNKYGVKICYI